MRNVFERRRKLVLDLIDKRYDGRKSAFAVAAKRSASQVGHITYPPGHDGHKDIGENLAREIEKECGLPTGLLLIAPADNLKDALEALANGATGSSVDKELPLHGQARNVFVRYRTEGERGARRYATVATNDPHTYLLEVKGTALTPWALPGDVLMVQPSLPVELEDDVVVECTDGGTVIGRLLSLRGGWRLGQYGSAPVVLPTDKVGSVHVVAAVLSRHLVFDA